METPEIVLLPDIIHYLGKRTDTYKNPDPFLQFKRGQSQFFRKINRFDYFLGIFSLFLPVAHLVFGSLSLIRDEAIPTARGHGPGRSLWYRYVLSFSML